MLLKLSEGQCSTGSISTDWSEQMAVESHGLRVVPMGITADQPERGLSTSSEEKRSGEGREETGHGWKMSESQALNLKVTSLGFISSTQRTISPSLWINCLPSVPPSVTESITLGQKFLFMRFITYHTEYPPPFLFTSAMLYISWGQELYFI